MVENNIIIMFNGWLSSMIPTLYLTEYHMVHPLSKDPMTLDEVRSNPDISDSHWQC